MSKEKEILQRFFKGESQRSIAAVLQVSRNTVAKVIRACHEHRIDAASLDGMDLDALHHHLFPEKADLPCQVPPDYEFIYFSIIACFVLYNGEKLIDDHWVHLVIESKLP